MKKKQQHMPVVIVCILIILVAVIGLATHFILKYTPTREKADLNEYYGTVQEGEAALAAEYLQTSGEILSLIGSFYL